MLINSFTLIDAFNQFWKACEDGDRRALSCAGLTYFYLCRVWNATGRSISFRHQNTLVCANLNISKPTLEKHRNILKQAGLIDFFSKGKGDPNIYYKILEARTQSEEVKKENNFTSSFTSPFTSEDAYKQSKELFIVVEGVVKNFYYLKGLFEVDEGLLRHWANQGFAAEKFPDGLERWMTQTHSTEYLSFKKARDHFFFWLPKYLIIVEKPKTNDHNNKAFGKPGAFTAGKIKGGSIDDLQSLKRVTGDGFNTNSSTGGAEDNTRGEEWAQADIIE